MDEQGIETGLGEQMTQIMEPSVTTYIEACAVRTVSAEEEVRYLNDLIRSFHRWRSR